MPKLLRPHRRLSRNAKIVREQARFGSSRCVSWTAKGGPLIRRFADRISASWSPIAHEITSPFPRGYPSRFIQAWGNLCLTARAKVAAVRLMFSRLAEEVVCHIPELPLAPGRYVFNLFCAVGGGVVDWVQQAGYLDVAAGDYLAQAN